MDHPRTLAALVTLAALAASLAQAQTDPLKSAECSRALARLEEARSAPARDAETAAVRIGNARREASLACLGAAPATGRPSPVGQTPIRVAPAAVAAGVAGPAPAPALPPAPVIAPPRPVQAPSNCDAGGCWDASGQRLNRSGAQLIGPQGACTEQAGVLLCR